VIELGSRVEAAMRRENRGTTAQRVEAICSRSTSWWRMDWRVVYEDEVPVRMEWASRPPRQLDEAVEA
jgi:hypothetical protein